MSKKAGLAIILSVCIPFLFSCASNSNVLAQVNNAGETQAQGESIDSPAESVLEQELQKLGYQGVGLKYETAQTIDLLAKVFADPAVANRQIALVYTGLAMSYDTSYKSLTVGGLKDVPSIVAFIKRNVPVKPIEKTVEKHSK